MQMFLKSQTVNSRFQFAISKIGRIEADNRKGALTSNRHNSFLAVHRELGGVSQRDWIFNRAAVCFQFRDSSFIVMSLVTDQLCNGDCLLYEQTCSPSALLFLGAADKCRPTSSRFQGQGNPLPDHPSSQFY